MVRLGYVIPCRLSSKGLVGRLSVSSGLPLPPRHRRWNCRKRRVPWRRSGRADASTRRCSSDGGRECFRRRRRSICREISRENEWEREI